MILNDTLVRGVRDGSLLNDYRLELLEYNVDKHIVKISYEGVWFMVDNGYLERYCTVSRFKDGVTYEYIRFFEWLESMRTDLKWAIRIFKRIFSCLKQDLRLRSLKTCDKVWLVCCALYTNLL